MASGDASIPYVPALGLAALVVASCVGVATVVFSRRDVTSQTLRLEAPRRPASR